MNKYICEICLNIVNWNILVAMICKSTEFLLVVASESKWNHIGYFYWIIVEK